MGLVMMRFSSAPDPYGSLQVHQVAGRTAEAHGFSQACGPRRQV